MHITLSDHEVPIFMRTQTILEKCGGSVTTALALGEGGMETCTVVKRTDGGMDV